MQQASGCALHGFRVLGSAIATTGDQLWQFQCGSGHHSSPCSYSIDGRQYIAVPTGWGAWTEGFLPGMLGAGQGSALFAFALPE